MTNRSRMLNLTCALTALIVSGTALGTQAAGPLSTFQENFDNLNNWVSYGAPSPLILATQFSRSGVFDNNGDGTNASGAISVQSFSGTGSFVLQADVYLDFSDTSLCDVEAAIGIANPTIQGWGGYDPYLKLSIRGVGRTCAELTDSLRAHAYFFGSFVTPSGTEQFFPTEPTPLLFRADQFVGGWHTLKITSDVIGRPRFYIDNTLIYSGANTLAAAVLANSNPLWIGLQSSGGAGKAYHDNLTFTNTCTWPAAINQLTPATAATLCNTLVTLSWSADAAATEYQIQVDNNSNFASPETDLRIPSSAASVAIVIGDDCLPRYWRVRGINSCGVGAWSSSRSLTVCTTLAVPPLVLPADAATDVVQPVEFDWDAVTGASAYSFQLDNNSDFGSPVSNVSVVPTGYTVSLLTGSTTYYWRVRADNTCGHSSWSPVRSFVTEVCILPDSAVLQLPVTGSSNMSQPVTVDWGDAALASSYRLQVDDDSLFASPTFDQQVTPSTAQVSGLPAGSMSYWRVRSFNACGWSGWSNTFKFSTCAPLGGPTLVEPADSALLESMPAFFDWNVLPDADSYLVEIDVVNTFDSPGIYRRKMGSVLTQFGSYDLAHSMRYYWRVRAYSDCGWGSFSSMRTCSLGTMLAVEEIETGTLPTKFQLEQNYPNPFNAETAIEFDVSRTSWVRLDVLNILGQQVATIVDEVLSPGRKRAAWNGADVFGRVVPSGVYFYRLRADAFVETRKMILLK